ncbi:hypothetical protein ACV242_001879 [Peribacillus simplex]
MIWKGRKGSWNVEDKRGKGMAETGLAIILFVMLLAVIQASTFKFYKPTKKL